MSKADIEAAYTKEYNHCLTTGDAAQGITVALLSCAGEEFDRQDVRLNQAYQAAMARLPDAAAKTRLRDAERAWIKERERKCSELTEPDSGGGTADSLNRASCMVDEAIIRTKELEREGTSAAHP